MEFNQLIDEFAKRHNVENLVAVDDAAALDIDGIIVTIVAKGGVLNFSAEIGDPPVEGAGAFFAKVPDPGQYVIVQRLQLALVDEDAFDAALETFVNQTETWRRLLSDFRPVAKAAAESESAARPSFGSSEFMQV